MAVTGFLGKSSSRGGGVGTGPHVPRRGPHVPRSAWEARQVATAWSHVRGRTAVSKDRSRAGEGRDEAAAGLSRECCLCSPRRGEICVCAVLTAGTGG